ncbi:phage holin family protein [Clostridium sp. Marseille-Q2269]|uniref:phage holin family protein n=1 Tax=Clostridium sp. Marseille-Q2269 TaxID=2942205 RepID=UPI002073189D|nr:phage holin family protein [Clostridium sp. Marseille-Q2269]
MEINLINYIIDKELELIPVLYILGKMLKDINKIKDWTIPWILLVISIIVSMIISGLKMESIIQGVLCTGAAVYTNQLIKQNTKKKKSEQM